jgi:hypothetical protein
MLSDEIRTEIEEHVRACDRARDALEDALSTAQTRGIEGEKGEEVLRAVGEALGAWRDAQVRFMDAVEKSDAPSVEMAALVLKQNAGIDASNARRGLPGTDVDGADQPFGIDMSGDRGAALTEAAMNHLPDVDT